MVKTLWTTKKPVAVRYVRQIDVSKKRKRKEVGIAVVVATAAGVAVDVGPVAANVKIK